jgi:acetyltransferase
MHTAALVLADGSRLGLRPIVADDRDALATWFGRLSPESRRRRFLGHKSKLTARELTYLTDVDHVTHAAFVAVDETDSRIVGVARYATGSEDGRTADVGVAIADEWQGRGLGTRLTAQLVRAARANGMACLTAMTLWENAAARALLRRFGFRPAGSEGDALAFELPLS